VVADDDPLVVLSYSGGDFTPDRLRATPDAPFVRDVVAHCGVDHRDLVLDPAALSDPELRRTVVAARDAPSSGDMDASLHLLFRAVREHVTVVLSGESADEVFGGYPWFHDSAALAAADYPWRYFAGRSGTYRALLRQDVAAELDVTAHRAQHYRQALVEVPVLAGESVLQRRMRDYLDPTALRNRLSRPDSDRATRAGLDFALSFDLWLRSSGRR
jgi:asparagine synthase (glutamine-hydrolysing)